MDASLQALAHLAKSIYYFLRGVLLSFNDRTYPTVVSDTTAHQNPSGEPSVNAVENVLFVLCSCCQPRNAF